MKLKCLKFFFSKFCGLLREDIDKSRHRHGVVKFLQGHIRSSFSPPPPPPPPRPPPHYGVPYFAFQGPIFPVSLGPRFPVFMFFVGSHQGPGSRFSSFFRVPLGSHQGPGSRFFGVFQGPGSQFSGFSKVPLGTHQGPGSRIFGMP